MNKNKLLFELKNFNFKNIKGFNNYLISKNGEIYSLKRKKLLSWNVKKDGYAIIGLMQNPKKRKFLYIHRLVGYHFLMEVSGKNEINHKDGNKLNNNYKNLEWCTRKENQVHASRIGSFSKMKKGEDHWATELNDIKVIKIKNLLRKNKLSLSEIAKLFSTNVRIISDIKRGKTWNHLN